MNLENLSISIRERSQAEVYDLAILLCRQHWRALSIFALINITPFLILDAFLFIGGQSTDGAEHLLIGAVLLAQIPLMTAPITLYLGNALFRGNTSIQHCLKTAWKSSPQLFWYGIISPLLILSPAHQTEVVMLEQLKGSKARKRGYRLLNGWRSDYLGQLMISSIIITLCMATTSVFVAACKSTLMFADAPGVNLITYFEACVDMLNLQESILSYICLIPLIVYMTSVRFLSYINLRTLREGWSTELHIKAAAEKQFGPES